MRKHLILAMILILLLSAVSVAALENELPPVDLEGGETVSQETAPPETQAPQKPEDIPAKPENDPVDVPPAVSGEPEDALATEPAADETQEPTFSITVAPIDGTPGEEPAEDTVSLPDPAEKPFPLGLTLTGLCAVLILGILVVVFNRKKK